MMKIKKTGIVDEISIEILLFSFCDSFLVAVHHLNITISHTLDVWYKHNGLISKKTYIVTLFKL